MQSQDLDDAIIYRPGGQAFEFAALAVSPHLNCGMGCKYCFVPRQRHITREEFDSGAVWREDYIPKLTRAAIKFQQAGIIEQVLASFMSDVYHAFDTRLTRRTLIVLIAHGLGVCVLSKGGFAGAPLHRSIQAAPRRLRRHLDQLG